MTTSLADFQIAANNAQLALSANNAELNAIADKANAIDPNSPDAKDQLLALENQKKDTLKSIKARSVTIFRELNALNKDVPPADLAAAIDIYENVLRYNTGNLAVAYNICETAIDAKQTQISAIPQKQDIVVETHNAPSSNAEVRADLPPANNSGLGTGNFTDKITEGVTSAVERFGPKSIVFEKIVSNGPTIDQLKNPLAIAQSQGKTLVNPVINDLIANRVDQPTPASAQATNAATGANKPNPDDKTHLVTLDDQQGNIVEFLVMPEIIENRAVGYEPVAPAQFPGAFQKYKGTESVQWQVNATFISRTTEEATKNLINLNILRGWTMPYFGDKIKTGFRTDTKLGAPPPVLIFKGFRYAIVGPVPVVITSLNWSWPRDVDYIQAIAPDGSSFNVPFPTVMTVAIQLVESFSTEQFNKFDRDAYRYGDFEGAFGGVRAFAKNGNSADSEDPLLKKYEKIKKEGGLTKEQTDAIINSPSEAQTIEGSNKNEGFSGFNEMVQGNPIPSNSERKIFGDPYVSSTVVVQPIPGFSNIVPPQ